jgi:hypothetical protein
MRKCSTLASLFLLLSTSAWATMPMLPEMPKNKSPKSCEVWAQQAIKGDEDIALMWGLQESGDSSAKIAIKRLVLSCLGREMPEIVGFYSSAGVAQEFCEDHKQTRLCKKWKEEHAQ